MSVTRLAPVPPGEILRLDLLEPLGITPYRLAKDIGVPATRIHEILNGKRAVTADTAQRLGRYFSTSAELWLNLQSRYELDQVRQGNREAIEAIQPLQRPTPRELADEQGLAAA